MTIQAEDLNRAGAAIWPIVADAALKGLIVLAAAGAASLLMRRASAAARHLLWTLAAFATLALPVLASFLPGWRILPNWMAHEPAPQVAAAPANVPMASHRATMPLPPVAGEAGIPDRPPMLAETTPGEVQRQASGAAVGERIGGQSA